MTAVQILIGVASVLERDAARYSNPSQEEFDEMRENFSHQAMRVHEAIDLIKGGEYRQFEFKGASWTRLPSGKIVRGK